jgi:alpha-D-xyloside xylohydrolase
MLLEFPEDPAVETLDRQYMLGDSLLVAPVFNEEGKVSFYLPKGKWTHLLSNEQVNGGTWRLEEHDYFSLPLYVRPNSIIALGAVDSKSDYDFAEDVVLHLFELEDRKTTTTTVRNMKSEVELEVSATRNGNKITVTNEVNTRKPWSLIIRGISKVTSVVGGVHEETVLGAKITPEYGVEIISITCGK